MKGNVQLIVFFFVSLFIGSNSFAADVNLYFTRHGKTMFNTMHRVQGWSDTPLTKEGIEVAEQLGRGLSGLDFVAVYSSDLGRARETARVILKAKGDALPIIEMPEFREVCFGSFEGDLEKNMWGEAAKKLGYKNTTALHTNLAANKITLDKIVDTFKLLDESGMGEASSTVKARMLEGLKNVAKKIQMQGGGNALIVTHGMALTAMANEFMDKPFHGQLKNASITKIHYTDTGKFIVESINDTNYIEKEKTK